MTRLILRLILFFTLFGLFMGGNLLVNRWFIVHRGGQLDGVSILIAGDSHLLTAVNPEYLPRSANICQNAEPYIVTFHKLRYFLRRNPGIEAVVLGFSYHNLSAFNDLKFLDNAGAKALFDRVYSLMKRSDFAPLKVDRRKYYRSVVRHMLLYPTVDHSKAFTGEFEAVGFGLDRADVATTIARHYYHDGANIGVSLVATSYLDSIATLCEHMGRRLVLLSPPLRDEYVERVPENFVAHFREVRALCNARGVTVLDYSGVEWEGKFFKDYDHLDKDGAVRLTKMLADWFEVERSRAPGG